MVSRVTDIVTMLSVVTGMSTTALQWQQHHFEDILRKNPAVFKLLGRGVKVFDMVDLKEKIFSHEKILC